MTYVSDKLTTARKTHVCNLCYNTISPGTRYWVNVARGEEGYRSFKTCLPCNVIAMGLWGTPWAQNGLASSDMQRWAHRHPGDLRAQAFLERLRDPHTVDANGDEGEENG